MDERVEEIRRRHDLEMESPLLGYNKHYDEIGDLLTALAQAERELSEIRKSLYLCDVDRTTFAHERDEARAEVERLKREVAEGFKVEVADVTGDSAMMAENGRLKADLARVRAVVESNRKRNVLGQHICDDCGKEWPTHDLEFCIVGQIVAALEGR